MTKSYILFAVVFTSIFVLLSSCACTKKENQMIPNDFHLRFGAGGGFTGIWSGYFINQDGNVLKWEGKMGNEKFQDFGNLSNEAMGYILKEIKSKNIMMINMQNTGNMTMSINITLDSLENNILFTADSSNDTSKVLQKFYQNLDSTIKSIKK